MNIGQKGQRQKQKIDEQCKIPYYLLLNSPSLNIVKFSGFDSAEGSFKSLRNGTMQAVECFPNFEMHVPFPVLML